MRRLVGQNNLSPPNKFLINSTFFVQLPLDGIQFLCCCDRAFLLKFYLLLFAKKDVSLPLSYLDDLTMTEIILHQYASSPFSEKIRCLLGYKQQNHSLVEIPIIMPKPDLIALTGGYRKTPVLQRGSNIYCDTAIICKFLDQSSPEKSIFPKNQEMSLIAAAHWTDTFFFKIAVAVAFQPKALASLELFQDPESAEAFMTDRAELTKGSAELTMSLETAIPYWLMQMTKLEAQLNENAFLGGEKPNILDFSTYHCCWFVYGNDSLKSDLTAFPSIDSWMQKMSAFNREKPSIISGDNAIEIAKNTPMVLPEHPELLPSESFLEGKLVQVMPIDYGFQPTEGLLISASIDEIIIKRTDHRAGELLVHFPRLGFQIAPRD